MEGGVNSELSKHRYEKAMEDSNMAMALIGKGGYYRNTIYAERGGTVSSLSVCLQDVKC